MNLHCPTKPSPPVSTQPDRAMTAQEIAQAVAGGKMTALAATEAALARIAKHDSILNSFTDVTADRARAKAAAVDAASGTLYAACGDRVSTGCADSE